MRFERTKEHNAEIVNPETGEVSILKSTSSKTFTTRVSGESYYMTFLAALAPSLDLKMGELRMMCILNTYAHYNTGTFALTTKGRDEICELLKIKKQSLSNSLNGLKKKKLLTYDRGEWQINPAYFWKGEMKVREAKLKDKQLRVTFDIEDVSGQITPDEDF